MGILTDDDGLIDAALSELKSLPLDLRHRRDPRRDFSYILKQHHLGQVSKRPPSHIVAPSHPFSPPRPNHEANHANIEIELMVILLHRENSQRR
jgi:superkiller protein 3